MALIAGQWPWNHSEYYAGHVGQHNPFVVVGFEIALVHMVGKHHTLGQKVLALPPLVPVAPVMAASTLMLGLTQYGQQWPETSVDEKPAGHLRLAAQVIPSQGSLIPLSKAGLSTCTNIFVFMSLSRATTQLPLVTWSW